MKLTTKYSPLLICLMIAFLSSTNSNAENKKYEKIVNGRVYTLWADKKNCQQDGALILSIETKDDNYKVAACSKYGCRIAIEEFGKHDHTINYKTDPLFNWISERVFETKINGNKKRFFQCEFVYQ